MWIGEVMIFTTIGITAIDLLFANDSQLQKFYSLVSGLSKRDITTLVMSLTLNNQSLKNIQKSVDETTEEYSTLLEDIQEFESRFLTAEKKQPDSLFDDDDDFFGIKATNEFGGGADDDNLLDSFDNLFDDMLKETDTFEIFKNNSWRNRVRKSEDYTILETHYKSLLDRYSALPVIFTDNNTPSDPDIARLEEKFILELNNRIHKTDSIISDIYKYSGRDSEIAGIPIYKDYYMFRKNIFRLISDTYTNATESKYDESLASIDKFLSGDPIKYTQNYHEDLVPTIQKYTLTVNNSASSKNPIIESGQLMSTLNEYFTLLVDMQNNVNHYVFEGKEYSQTLLNRLSVDMASRYSIVGYIPNGIEMLVKNAFCIYKSRGKKRELSANEKNVFCCIKMSLISMKYGFKR